MADFIILTQENRDHVAGPSLQPVARQGGTDDNPDPVFILNRDAVLADPEHQEFHAYLGALPYKDISDPTFPPAFPVEEE